MQTKKNILKAIALFCLTAVLLSMRPAKHPYYLSVCDINIEPKFKHITLSCRIFADDLQQELLQEYKIKANFLVQTETQKKALNQYLAAHLKIRDNKQNYPFNVIGYEVKEESVWIYAEANCNKTPGHLLVQNTLLCKGFSGQSNIVHVNFDLLRESHKHTCTTPEHLFDFVP